MQSCFDPTYSSNSQYKVEAKTYGNSYLDHSLERILNYLLDDLEFSGTTANTADQYIKRYISVNQSWLAIADMFVLL